MLGRRLVVLIPALAFAQSASFEVASLKPDPALPNQKVFRFSSDGAPSPRLAERGRYYERHIALQDLVKQAYGVRDYQLSGLPDWSTARAGEYFEVEAKAGGDVAPPVETLQAMLRSLLADRFQLKVHTEMRRLPVYAIVIAKGEVNMHEVYGDLQPGQSTVDRMLSLMMPYADRPLIDETGLSGRRYEFPASIFTALMAQRGADSDTKLDALRHGVENLGLKLEPREQNIAMLVIDRAERPSSN